MIRGEHEKPLEIARKQSRSNAADGVGARSANNCMKEPSRTDSALSYLSSSELQACASDSVLRRSSALIPIMASERLCSICGIKRAPEDRRDYEREATRSITAWFCTVFELLPGLPAIEYSKPSNLSSGHTVGALGFHHPIVWTRTDHYLQQEVISHTIKQTCKSFFMFFFKALCGGVLRAVY